MLLYSALLRAWLSRLVIQIRFPSNANILPVVQTASGRGRYEHWAQVPTRQIRTNFQTSRAISSLRQMQSTGFAMIGPVEGALFVDMGNIWSLKDNRPGTEFEVSKFYKELAIGSGVGLRYDFSYVILRIDLGGKTS